jgi:hypothetical protein
MDMETPMQIVEEIKIYRVVSQANPAHKYTVKYTGAIEGFGEISGGVLATVDIEKGVITINQEPKKFIFDLVDADWQLMEWFSSKYKVQPVMTDLQIMITVGPKGGIDYEYKLINNDITT